jgi:hypothetical protein
MKCKMATRASVGAQLGFKPVSEPMSDWADVIDPSDGQALAEDGFVRARTVGPTAKQREQRRLLGEALSRQAPPPDRPRELAGRARRRERRERRSFSRGGDGGSEDGESEPPPDGRHCSCGCGSNLVDRAAQARYLNDAHAAAARQRRKRAHDRDPANGSPDLPVPCRCAPRRAAVEPGRCLQCGRGRDEWLVAPATAVAA